MKYKLTFKEADKQGLRDLEKQPPITLEIAKHQVAELKENSIAKNKKKQSIIYVKPITL